jgi:hypothetical protein
MMGGLEITSNQLQICMWFVHQTQTLQSLSVCKEVALDLGIKIKTEVTAGSQFELRAEMLCSLTDPVMGSRVRKLGHVIVVAYELQ